MTVKAESQSTQIYGTAVSDIQDADVAVSANAIVGTLKYLDSGSIAGYWGAGYFLALKFSGIDGRATSVKVGLDPSEGSGLVELLGDTDMNGVFKITDQDVQKFKVVITDGHVTKTQTFDLSGLVFES